MKQKLTVLLLAILLLFTSCDLMLSENKKGKIYLICCGLGYEGGTDNQALINPLNDADALISEFKALCEAGGYEYEIVHYTDDVSKNGLAYDNDNRFVFKHYSNESPDISDRTMYLYPTPSPSPDKLNADYLTSQFLGTLDKMLEPSMPTNDDLLIFFYSGHGEDSLAHTPSKPSGPVAYYQTYCIRDKEGNIEKSFINDFSAISYDSILNHLDKYKGRQLVILDCCYSGASTYNPEEYLHRDDNELGYSVSFYNHSDNPREDWKEIFNVSTFMEDSWNKTFDGTGGKPRRFIINSCTYAQLSMNADFWIGEPFAEDYGGLSYRLLKYLGYDVENKIPGISKELKGKVISVTGIFRGIYDNISRTLLKTATPNMTRTSYDMAIWDLR